MLLNLNQIPSEIEAKHRTEQTKKESRHNLAKIKVTPHANIEPKRRPQIIQRNDFFRFFTHAKQ